MQCPMNPTEPECHAHTQDRRYPNKWTKQKFRSEKPTVVIVFDGYEFKQSAQSLCQILLPRAIAIHSVYCDDTFLLRIVQLDEVSHGRSKEASILTYWFMSSDEIC